MIKRVVTVALGLALPLSLLGGCSSSAARSTGEISPGIVGADTTVSPTGTGTASTSKSTSPTTKAPLNPTTGLTTAQATVQVTNRNNGGTIVVAQGSTIQVLLSSTYWIFPAAPNAAVLHQLGDVVKVPAPLSVCRPGEGCGTASVIYQVVGSGQATIIASRTSCGEALACGPAEGSFAVHVNVP